MNEISFPADEHAAIRQRLADGLIVATTRIQDEIGKYVPGRAYQTPWGDVLWVTRVANYEQIEDHPYYDELTYEWKLRLAGLPGEVVWLTKLSPRSFAPSDN